ncbi:TPA: c-type cytochrome [Pseudomonas aeruginosa]
MLAQGAWAKDPEVLFKNKGCVACHAIDAKMVGPAYKDVAAKFAGQAGAEAELAQRIKNGSQGVWGPIPMPPNAVSDDEAQTLAKWVLSQK